MTDEELIARLRDADLYNAEHYERDPLHKQSANRIEALTKERDQHWDSFVHWRKEADALTEQLEAARADAKAAEDELEMQEQEACMMENDYIKLEKERDALEAKLAKTVEALEKIAGVKGPYSHPFPEASEGYGAFAIVTSRATLAEIKGESHE